MKNINDNAENSTTIKAIQPGIEWIKDCFKNKLLFKELLISYGYLDLPLK